ncbi:MAG: asparagine synthase-related protein, partial [Candidatus Thorarchaeota archaeon]
NIKDFSINHIFDFNKKKIMNFSFLQKMSYIDCKHWLPDNLLIKLDISTMRNSIEGRVPYLDSQLANFLFNIPDSLKINNGVSKFILRKISKQYLPLKILKRRKQGFAIPFQDWYNKGLKDFFETCIYNHSKVIKKFFPKQYVQNLIDKSSGVLNNIKKIWTLFIFLYWLIKNISNNEFYYFD